MLRWVHILFALICAAALSQFPAYFDQYKQRLGGALDETEAQLQALDERAAAQDMARYDYIRHFQDNPDDVVRKEGDAMLALIARQQWLRDAKARLDGASDFMILIETAFHLDPKIAENAMKDFVPALPLSIAGAFHAFIGFLLGYLVPSGIRSLFPKRVVRNA